MRVHLLRTQDAIIPDLDSLALPFARWFFDASARGLSLDLHYHEPIGHTGPCASWELHDFVNAHLPAPATRPVEDVAIIFCPSWEYGGLYGLMFDWDTDKSPLGPFSSQGIPRQGCAVFMDEHDGTHEHPTRTAIHELGHVFNLVHDVYGHSFMGSPPLADGFGEEDGDRLWLAALGNWYYAPGGANYWGEGVIDPPTLRRARGLQLRAGTSGRVRLPGEPIPLSLHLSVDRGEREVADRLDPGHGELRIWIETPLGERVLHRPPERFCASDRFVTISPRRGLRNNPRITLSGFADNRLGPPGTYHVWAEFRPSPGTRLESNVVDIGVRLPENDDEARASEVLSRPATHRFLVDKGGPIPRGERNDLHAVLGKVDHPALAYARYAMAWDAARGDRWDEASEWLGDGRFGDGSLRSGIRRLEKEIEEAGG